MREVFAALTFPGWSFLVLETKDTSKGYVDGPIVVYEGFEINGKRKVRVTRTGDRRHVESDGGGREIAAELFKQVLRTYGARP